MTISVATSLGVFLRKIAIDYVRYGYYWYAVREIPEGKDLSKVDRKIIRAYGITHDRCQRLRQYRRGYRKIAYVRYNRHFILIATDGENQSFDRIRYYDIRHSPIHFKGYSISVTKEGKPVVAIGKKRWQKIVQGGEEISLHDYRKVSGYIKSVGLIRFPEILNQQKKLSKLINEKRKVAGLPIIKYSTSQSKK